MTKVEAVKHDRVRHLILKSLSPGHPESLDTVVLRRHMGTFGYPMTEEDLNSYIAYLEEKKLVKVDKRPGNIVMVRITAIGIDALDARIDVKGVGQDLE
ncbi:MAG: hypothetical protein GY710_12060 [Desulfobacteraceae bacterium]|nr:hypothetical protein [Desulfobacteraceae bacterium]